MCLNPFVFPALLFLNMLSIDFCDQKFLGDCPMQKQKMVTAVPEDTWIAITWDENTSHNQLSA